MNVAFLCYVVQVEVMPHISLCPPQHHCKGTEGSASYAQLQSPQHSNTQRQITGTFLFLMSQMLFILVKLTLDASIHLP